MASPRRGSTSPGRWTWAPPQARRTWGGCAGRRRSPSAPASRSRCARETPSPPPPTAAGSSSPPRGTRWRSSPPAPTPSSWPSSPATGAGAPPTPAAPGFPAAEPGRLLQYRLHFATHDQDLTPVFEHLEVDFDTEVAASTALYPAGPGLLHRRATRGRVSPNRVDMGEEQLFVYHLDLELEADDLGVERPAHRRAERRPAGGRGRRRRAALGVGVQPAAPHPDLRRAPGRGHGAGDPLSHANPRPAPTSSGRPSSARALRTPSTPPRTGAATRRRTSPGPGRWPPPRPGRTPSRRCGPSRR